MLDERAREAQALYWRIQQARASGRDNAPEVADWFREMSAIHEERAKDLLDGNDPNGWIDLLAAATAAHEAGDTPRARKLIYAGWDRLWDWSNEARDTVEAQLADLERWLDPTQPKASLRPVPANPFFRDRNPFHTPSGPPREATV